MKFWEIIIQLITLLINIIKFIFVKYYRSSIFFLLVIINYKYNNLLNIILVVIITVKLL